MNLNNINQTSKALNVRLFNPFYMKRYLILKRDSTFQHFGNLN